jgi:hypothetical protein
MKSKITPQAEPPPTFPALYRNMTFNYIVMFTNYTTGIVVVSSILSPYKPIGYYADEWVSCERECVWEKLPTGSAVTLIQE